MLLLLLALILMVGPAIANRTSSGSAQDGTQTGPITLNYPGGLTMQLARTGTPVVIDDAADPLNAIGGVTAAQMTPSISATTNSASMTVSAQGCTLSAGRCANRDTITLTFNRAVTNPVIHLSGLGGNQGTTTQQYHASFLLTSWVATGTPTLTLANGASNLTVAGNEIRVATVNGGTTCGAATPAGCGSVRVNGTVTSVTFQVDMLTAGTGTPTATNIDAFNMTVSVDEDFGDGPAGYETAGPASHIVGGLYLGAGVTADNVATTNTGTTVSPISGANATGDTDNGVTIPTLSRGSTAIINVAVTGTGGLLQGWIDWGGDGSYATAGDQIATNAVDGGAGDSDGSANGVIALSVPVPQTAVITQTISRFRISTTSGLSFTGLAPDGEVEDYAVTPVQPPYADLSLIKTINNASPANGSNIIYTLTLSNAAAPSQTVSSVTVTDNLPAGVTYVSSAGSGGSSYNSSTGAWTVPTIAAGGTQTLTITATVNATAGATIINAAEVTSSPLIDIDSTPNDGTGDDYATRSFTVSGTRTAGTPPALVCSAGQSVFDWDPKTWTAGSLNNSYTQTGVGLVNIAMSSNVYQVRTSQTPFLDNAGFTGGLTPAQRSLVYAVDFANRQEVQTTLITFPTTIGGAQFRLFDIDYDVNQYSDRVVVTGLYQGNTVIPVLTNGVTNYVTGNTAVGDTIANNTSSEGNVVVTFNAPIDSILVTYGNDATLAPADPTGQTMAIHDITYCNPRADISVTKVSSIISDGVSASNPKSIPGAIVRYCILATNAGSAAATGAIATDNIPSNLTFIAGSMATGTTCTNATQVEDDDATGADESDPYGMSRSGSTITGSAPNLASGAGFAMVFNATIN